jgi:putative peptide zinc metalloprotease protein
MALMLLGLIGAVPRLLGSAYAVVREDLISGRSAWDDGNALDVASHALQVLGVLLPAMACVLVLSRVGTRTFGGLARWGQHSGGRRLTAITVSALMVTALSWAWWPHPGAYRPIAPDEGGLLTSLLPGAADPAPSALVRPAPAGSAHGSVSATGAAVQERLSDADRPLVAVFDDSTPLPTKEHPSMALVLVPAGGSVASAGTGTDTTPNAAPSPGVEHPPAEPWVLPFDQPLPADAGDNQALAVNTDDGSVVYDVAFALVWADGDEVLNVNEAHAYASCSDCVAVAVAFQVVLVMEDARVVVPQNLAVAANYECYRCITAAVASQLVLSIDGEPGEAEVYALGRVWAQLLQLATNITSYSLDEISSQLEDFKSQIVEILAGPPPPTGSSSALSTTGSAAPTHDASGTPTVPPSGGAPAPVSPSASTTPQPSTGPTGTTTAPPPGPQAPTTIAPTSEGPTESPSAEPSGTAPTATP